MTVSSAVTVNKTPDAQLQDENSEGPIPGVPVSSSGSILTYRCNGNGLDSRDADGSQEWYRALLALIGDGIPGGSCTVTGETSLVTTNFNHHLHHLYSMSAGDPSAVAAIQCSVQIRALQSMVHYATVRHRRILDLVLQQERAAAAAATLSSAGAGFLQDASLSPWVTPKLGCQWNIKGGSPLSAVSPNRFRRGGRRIQMVLAFDCHGTTPAKSPHASPRRQRSVLLTELPEHQLCCEASMTSRGAESERRRKQVVQGEEEEQQQTDKRRRPQDCVDDYDGALLDDSDAMVDSRQSWFGVDQLDTDPHGMQRGHHPFIGSQIKKQSRIGSLSMHRRMAPHSIARDTSLLGPSATANNSSSALKWNRSHGLMMGRASLFPPILSNNRSSSINNDLVSQTARVDRSRDGNGLRLNAAGAVNTKTTTVGGDKWSALDRGAAFRPSAKNTSLSRMSQQMMRYLQIYDESESRNEQEMRTAGKTVIGPPPSPPPAYSPVNSRSPRGCSPLPSAGERLPSLYLDQQQQPYTPLRHHHDHHCGALDSAAPRSSGQRETYHHHRSYFFSGDEHNHTYHHQRYCQEQNNRFSKTNMTDDPAHDRRVNTDWSKAPRYDSEPSGRVLLPPS